MTGIASDTLSSSGHPGFPADSSEIDHNFIYANNFDLYDDKAQVKPLVGVPIGVGVIYAGMNDAKVHDNWFFDNWRHATMLFAVPDPLTSNGGAEGAVYPGISCAGAPDNQISTSCGNRQYDNKLGQVPAGFTFPEPLERYGVVHSEPAAKTMPNGIDFWWDEFPTNRWNCWYGNTGPDGTAATVTGSGEGGNLPGVPPNLLPDCSGGANPDLSIGNADVAKEAYLVDCSNGPDEDTGPLDCDWWTVPAKPGSAAAAETARKRAIAARGYERTDDGARMRARLQELTAGAVG